ncbi:uncharacterized protein [Onthophagus taurus]|uniref:uncharacterized protein n=1 Tax=Onthophagus taurus TaxID=166361 RepID=UPI0039BDEEEC
MTTSVTLPSNSAPLHGVYPAVQEESNEHQDFEPTKPTKRCLPPSPAESCKKRRKQSTPVRISALDTEVATEGKPLERVVQEHDLRCPICHLPCETTEKLENHVRLEHSLECKKEVEEVTSLIPERSITPRQEQLPWMNEMPNKEWLNPNLLTFPAANHMFMSLTQFPQPDAVPPRQPIRIFNPDAYCELCNKEFCNKYFLKTHKANKHGIYTDPPNTEGVSTPVTVPSFVGGSVKLPSNVPIDIKTEPKPVLNMFSDLFANPFANKISKPNLPPKRDVPKDIENDTNGISTSTLATISTLPTLPTHHEPENKEYERNDEPSSSPNTNMIKNEIIDTDNNLYYSTPPCKMSPGQQQGRELDLSNRLRRIGVMNPKAFCEICCKEYCNKYFLRTHKMKRHGIYIPDDGKDSKMDNSNMLWHQNAQTSPLNLIMAEQANSSMLQGDRKTSSPTDISCELCGIKFQNASLLQLHNVSVHANPNLSKLSTNQESSSNGSEEENKQIDDSIKPNDTISEDLQKLQTMILQLNDLDVNNKTNCSCTVCGKEFENRYFLHAHMMTEHGLLLDDIQQDVEKPNELGENTNNNTMCESVQEMKKQLMESSNEVKEDFNGFTTPEKLAPRVPQVNPERRPPMNMTPTSSYCEICNKELCNKYFMKTHMQRMHGIEIENGAQIGGVICDICNKELCSKYFLRVHKHNTHGIVEYGSSLLQPRKGEDQPPPPPIDDTSLKPTDLADLSHRYFTHFTEVCGICSRRFRSTKWLKAHLLSDHGQAGVDKWTELEQQLQHSLNQKPRTPQPVERASPTIKIPSSGQENLNPNPIGIQNVLSSIFGDDESNLKTYHCSYCPFTTPILPFLFVHERSHMQNTEADFKCPVCGQTFHQSELLQHHVFTQHPFFPLPPFFNANGDGDPKDPAELVEGFSEPDTDDAKTKTKKSRRKTSKSDPDVGSSLKDMAKRSQLPATYALPQTDDASNYVMQPFTLEEASPERRLLPSLVFLPVLQKQSAPITITFTLTPA